MNKNELRKFYEQLKKGEIKSHVGLLQKIAKGSSASEFVDYYKTNELPSVKLTTKEMELAKGGIGWLAVIAIIEICDLAYSAGKGIYDGYKGNAHGTS